MKTNFTRYLIIVVLFFCSNNFTTAQVNMQDSLALVDLYNSTNGPNWFWQDNWLSGAPVSAWKGVTVTDNRVTELYLFADPKGKLPASIGNLTGLTHLTLTSCNLHGTIPSTIGNLTKLTSLSFQYAVGLKGTIPSTMGNLINLEYLDLLGNKLEGSIPESLGNLTKLKRLDLSGNYLSGSIPSTFNNLTKLEYFNVTINDLSATIPSLNRLKNLKTLDLEFNEFTFAGMERIATHFPFANYSPQDKIPIYINGNRLSVQAGGKLENNTYKWYKDSILVATITGNNKYHPTKSGQYYVAVTNSIATQLTLYSETFNYVKSNSVADAAANTLYSRAVVSPNPATSNTTVSFNAKGKYTIIVTDFAGRILLSKTGISSASKNTYQFNVSKFARGLYNITITDENNNKQELKLNKQ
jgi:hypothetical protein